MEDLPQFIGQLAEIHATALARLTVSVPQPQADQLLDVATAAQRLGFSEDYLYRHAKDFPFTQRMGRNLRFSAQGIDRYIQKNRPK